jgi:hypothetical protein
LVRGVNGVALFVSFLPGSVSEIQFMENLSKFLINKERLDWLRKHLDAYSISNESQRLQEYGRNVLIDSYQRSLGEGGIADVDALIKAKTL